jgi:hypothetical protein
MRKSMKPDPKISPHRRDDVTALKAAILMVLAFVLCQVFVFH